MATRELDIPRTLPVDHLSVSSINAYLRCPEKWRRRYLEREYEAPSGAMILGGAVGDAEGRAYQEQVDTGERLSTDQVVDEFSDQWEERIGREDVDWRKDTPGDLKDLGVRLVEAYDTQVAPMVVPTSVEREFSLNFEHVDWTFTGFLDLETADGAVADLKVIKSKKSPQDAASDLQPTAYLLARRAEGNPAPVFQFHTMVKVKQPYTEVVPTVRTDWQLDAFTERVYRIAAEIAWRLENDVWQGAAPGAWWCSEGFCGFWRDCPYGGAR